MEFSEVLLKRRSTRSFTGGVIPSAHIRRILEAGLRAPNACNMQSWHFYCIIDREKILGLVPTVSRQAWIKDAAFVVVITEKIGVIGERYVTEDAGAAAENMLLAAADLGYNGCFIGAFDGNACKAYLRIPDEETPMVMLPIGTVDTETPLRERKPFEETVTVIGDFSDSEEVSKSTPFTLRSANISHAVFDDLNMDHASFQSINMEGVRFKDINMEGVRFEDINLSKAFFGGLRLDRSYFGCVDLQDAVFENPDFTGTSFTNCNLTDVEIKHCKLDGMTIDGIPVAELLKRNTEI